MSSRTEVLPEYGVSSQKLAEASTIMAKLCVATLADPAMSQEHKVEVLGSYIYLCDLSRGKHELGDAIQSDLEGAGVPKEVAASHSMVWSKPSLVASVARGDFIKSDHPEYGLRKTPKSPGHVDEKKLIAGILKLAS